MSSRFTQSNSRLALIHECAHSWLPGYPSALGTLAYWASLPIHLSLYIHPDHYPYKLINSISCCCSCPCACCPPTLLLPLSSLPIHLYSGSWLINSIAPRLHPTLPPIIVDHFMITSTSLGALSLSLGA